ncbi:MAG TPA: hypothetical protein VJC16_05635 [Candidatus Nanoarchaeia archaeon]|nr:hypothetical protein [Candidatus Nanoarchaeia archaeon]
MSKVIVSIMLLVVSMSAVYAVEKERVYQIMLKYDKGAITQEDVIVTMGFPQQRKLSLPDDYRLEVVSFSDKMVYTARFSFPLEIVSEPDPSWFDEQGNQIYFPNAAEAGHILLDEAEQLVIAPYFKDGEQVNVYDKNNELALEIDISHFAECRMQGYGCEKRGVMPYAVTIASLIALLMIIMYGIRKRKH